MRLLLALWLLVCPALGQPLADGQKFANLVQQGQWSQAAQMFSPEMARVFSARQLQQSWEKMTASHGPFRKFGTATVQPVKEFQVVLIPTEFAHYRCRMKVVLSQAGEVSGYFWVPYLSSRPPAYLETKVPEKKVTVGSWKLPGILTLPKKARAGVVLVQGSGPSDKDEAIGPNKPFRDLARGLAAQGIATLRYDKRTKVYGMAMSLGKVTLDGEVMEDALAALKLLRAELKGRPVILLGHSLGAILGPEMARRDGKLQGLIMLAGPSRPFDEALIDQLTYLRSLAPPDQAGPVDKIIEAVRHLPDLPDDDKSVLGAPAYYWRELQSYQVKSLTTLRNLKCPVLIVQGGRDYQSTAADYELWMQGLKGRPRVTGRLFPRLNHLFAPGEGKALPQEYEEENFMDPAVLELIGVWVGSL